MRYFEDGQIEEVYKRFDEGGILYFIKRTDTNQFFYTPMHIGFVHDYRGPDSNVGWEDSIGSLNSRSGAFLTREDAEEKAEMWGGFTQGGCRHCGNGSEPIPTIVIENEFKKKED